MGKGAPKSGLIENELENCAICGRKGDKIPYEAWHFCSQEHVKLYKEKTKVAERKMKMLRTCSTCGRPLKKTRWTMIDCSIRKIGDEFVPLKFCSEKCFDNWGAEKRKKDPLAEFFGVDSIQNEREIKGRRMRLMLVWEIIKELHPKGEIPIREIKRMGIEQGMTRSEVDDAIKSLKERELISEAGRGKVKIDRRMG
ncbi:MAG: hypothetical protein NTY20_01450 [Candidatus Aenigmarchaeota archaeon]|nr:hypothetical protein [Candidatus Aenigmarchaeota archaeon]